MTTALIVLLTVAAILLVFARKVPSAWRASLIILLMGLAVYGAIARLLKTEVRVEQSAKVQLAKSMGIMLGREIAQALPEGGAVAVLRMPKVAWVGFESLYDTEVDGLRSVLESPKYSVDVVYTPDPPNDEPLLHEFLQISEVNNLLQQVPSAKALVLQHTAFEPNQGVRPATLPPVFMILGDSTLTEQLLAKGFARAVVDYKPDIDWSQLPTRKMSPEEIFALRYQIKKP